MNSKHKQGFSLIELILYIALIAIFMSAAVYFAWDLILSSKKSDVQRTVNDAGRYISQRISYELRNASTIYSLTTTDLCMSSNDPAHDPTRIYQSGNELRIAWGGASTDCTNMTTDEALTPSNVSLTTLEFTDMSTTGSEHVTFSFTLESAGDRQEWQESQSYQSSAELRTP